MPSVKSLMTLAYGATAATGEICENVRDRVLEQMDTRSLLDCELTPATERILTKRKVYYFHQSFPHGDNYSFFTPDVSNTTMIEARSAEEANARAEQFGIRFRDTEWYEDKESADANRWVRATENDVIDAYKIRQTSYSAGVFIHFMDGTVKRYGECRPVGSHDYFDFWNGYNCDFTQLPEISGLSLIDEQDYKDIAEQHYSDRIPPQRLTTN